MQLCYLYIQASVTAVHCSAHIHAVRVRLYCNTLIRILLLLLLMHSAALQLHCFTYAKAEKHVAPVLRNRAHICV
jgi:hypothetical protein